MFSSAATMLALSQAQSLPLIIMLTGLAGMTSELYRPASSALLADLVPPEQRVTAFAWYRLAVNLGVAAGPSVAGLLASRSFLLIFVGDALTSLAFGLLALFALPESKHSITVLERKEQDGLLQALRHDYRYLLFLAGSTLIAFVYFQHLSTLALQVRADGLSSTVYGLLLSVNGICIIFLELPISSMTRRLSMQPVIATGWLLIALGFASIAAAHTIALLILTVAIWTLGEMVHSPVSAAYVANLAPAHLRGRYQGTWGLTWSAGLILGPALGTLLFSWNAEGLWLLCGVAGLLAALLVLLSGRLPARMSHE
jgi:MFS family permease